MQTKKLEWLIIAIGVTASLGYCLSSMEIMGLGKLTIASPLPLVFTGRNGIEDFESRHEVELHYSDGSTRTKPITAEDVRKITVPFDRFNIYMGTLALMPHLPDAPWHAVVHFAYCEPGEVGKDDGGERPVKSVTIHQIRRTKGRTPKQWARKHQC